MQSQYGTQSPNGVQGPNAIWPPDQEVVNRAFDYLNAGEQKWRKMNWCQRLLWELFGSHFGRPSPTDAEIEKARMKRRLRSK